MKDAADAFEIDALREEVQRLRERITTLEGTATKVNVAVLVVCALLIERDAFASRLKARVHTLLEKNGVCIYAGAPPAFIAEWLMEWVDEGGA